MFMPWKSESRSVMSDSLRPHGLYSPWNSPGQRGSSQPRDQIQVSRIAGRFFTSWATREGKGCWSGQPIPSPGDIPDLGIKPGSPALQADSLLTELSGKLMKWSTTTKKCQTTNRCNNVINFKDITLRERSQAQKSTHCMIPFI